MYAYIYIYIYVYVYIYIYIYIYISLYRISIYVKEYMCKVSYKLDKIMKMYYQQY